MLIEPRLRPSACARRERDGADRRGAGRTKGGRSRFGAAVIWSKLPACYSEQASSLLHRLLNVGIGVGSARLHFRGAGGDQADDRGVAALAIFDFADDLGPGVALDVG